MAYTNNNGQARIGVRIVPLSVVIPTISALLDSYSGAAAAYSLRKLKSSYTGSAIRVRRSSDNTELNIGFDSDGNLDTIALSVFVGTGDGFVTTWYDQSGNGNNAVQTTASSQPQIVSAGSVITMSNKPSVKFTTSNMSFTQIAGVSGLDIFVVSNFTDVTGGGQNWNIMSPILAETGGNAQDFVLGAKGSKMAIWAENNNSIFLQTTATISINTPYIYNGYGSSTSVGVGFNDGNYVTGTGRRNDLIVRALGKNSTSMQFYGNLSEVVVYNSLQTANRSGINTNLNTYYSVYPNPTSVWNLLNAVYSADTTASSSLKTSLFAAYNGESNTNDSFGTNNGTAVGGLTYSTGKIGNAFVFNGSNSYVSLPNNSFKFTGNFSVSLWFYCKTSSNAQTLINGYDYTGSLSGGWVLVVFGTGNFLDFQTYINTQATSKSRYQVGFNTSAYNNQWVHITLTRVSSTSTKIYINGTEASGSFIKGSVTDNPTYLTNCYSEIGGDFVTSGGFINPCDNGTKIDAVNIWNKELTASEVSELYNSGNGAQYITDNFYKPTTNDALLVNNGTAQGGLTYGLGKVGTAFVGNGTNAYITLANNSFKFTNSQSFSISTWVNITNSNVSNIIFSSWLYSGGQGYGWLLRTSPYSSTQCNLDFITDWQGGSGTPIPLSVSNAFTINTWVFVTATRNGSTGVEKIYVNGSQIATRTLTPNYLYTSNTVYPSILAQKYDSSSVNGYLNGKIDAVGIWNKELTSAEVTELYNSGNGKQYPN